MSGRKSRRLKRKAFLFKKKSLQFFRGKKDAAHEIVLILGCQRSGTSIMSEIFEYDLRTKVFGEVSVLSSPYDPKRLRLLPLPEVAEIIRAQKGSIAILKPLVESQHVHELLSFFPTARVIWMYRHYQDVISSNLIKFGRDTGIRDLRPIVNSEPANWRAENVSREAHEVVKKYFHEDMSQVDAAALFWYMRNRLFFDLELPGSQRVVLCQYDDLVRNPIITMKSMYSFLQIDYPKEDICRTIHSTSVRKGSNIQLSPEIQNLCEEMYSDLNAIYFQKEQLVKHA